MSRRGSGRSIAGRAAGVLGTALLLATAASARTAESPPAGDTPTTRPAAGAPEPPPAEARWPGFRGDGSGVASGSTYPRRWSATEGVAWSAAIPGSGWSSPIVWGERVFVTTALSLGGFKEPSPGIYGNDYIAELLAQGLAREEVMRRVRERDNEVAEEVPEGIRWLVLCLDASTGELLWQREVARGVPFGGRHRKNTYASETPVTDGRRVYAYFGNVGLFALGVDGEPLWSHRWEPRKTYLDFGTASSPLAWDGRILILNDAQELSTLSALDAATGELLWERQRPIDHPMVRTGFSTPFVWRNGRRAEVVALGAGKLLSYDRDGQELWRLAGTSAVAAPTPVADGDTLYIGSGSPSEPVRPIFAVRAGGSGDLTLAGGETASDFVAWYRPLGGSYIPSQVVWEGRLYVLYDKGFLAAFDAGDGRELYKVRLGSGSATFSASPWIAGGLLNALAEDGTTYVVRPGDEFELVARNPLDEMSLATPALAHGSIFLRTRSRLYRIGGGSSGER